MSVYRKKMPQIRKILAMARWGILGANMVDKYISGNCLRGFGGYDESGGVRGGGGGFGGGFGGSGFGGGSA